MRLLLSIIFCFSFFLGNSQDNKEITWLLNEKEINIEQVFINPNSIDSMKVEKLDGGGIVRLFSKKKIEFITLEQVISKHTELSYNTRDMVFFVDGKLAKQPDKVLIDSIFYVKAIVNKLDEVEGVSEVFKDFIVIDIQLYKKKEDSIMFRGLNKIKE